MKILCTECPNGCLLEITVQQEQITAVTGNQCPRGETYAEKELRSPQRYFTTTVQCRGLRLTVAPVRTTTPIPKEKLSEAVTLARQIVLTTPAAGGTVIKKDFIVAGTDLIVTRQIEPQ